MSTANDAERASGQFALRSLSKSSASAAIESPFISDPAEVSVLDIPREYVRRMEDAQRIYGEHHLQYRAFSQAKDHGLMTVSLQCCWLAIGAWVVSRGYRYSDPLNSLCARFTDSVKVRRITTPISCLGLVIFGVTCTQLPYDVRLVLNASQGLNRESQFMSAAMRVRDEAYREGKEATERVKRAETESLKAFMKK